jgi:hypothetical protein
MMGAMTESAASDVRGGRATAARVAKWLLDKERPDDAVAVLSAWAASGPNDVEGQTLLAEALRIDPSSIVAKLAFERMEGIAGDHGPLDAAIAKFDATELDRLERERKRPNFRRAQVGFNNNVKYKAKVYHVQTEDSGLDRPHVVTHLFADGGRIIKSHKRDYSDAVTRDDVATYVQKLMKEQQIEMVMMLREGRFDEIIAGRTIGGLELLKYPPKVDLQQIATKRQQRVEAPAESLRSPIVPPPSRRMPAVRAVARFRLHVLRSLKGGPDVYAPEGDEALIGAEGPISLPGERFCHRREAALRWKDGRVWLEDFTAGNGVFLRIHAPVELGFGDEFIVGDQLLRVERNPVPNDGPNPGPTYFYSSPRWISSFRVVQIFEGGASGACVVAHGTSLQVGATAGDFVFPNDPLVSEPHCLVEEQAGTIVLTDLGSKTGVFVRIKGEQELVHGDELLVGRTRLLLETL